MTPDSHKGWTAGDRVTVKESVAGYYSGYGYVNGEKRPEYNFGPEQIGIIGAVKVPKVTIRKSDRDQCPWFICVDWHCPETGKIERCSVHYNNIEKAT